MPIIAKRIPLENPLCDVFDGDDFGHGGNVIVRVAAYYETMRGRVAALLILRQVAAGGDVSDGDTVVTRSWLQRKTVEREAVSSHF